MCLLVQFLFTSAGRLAAVVQQELPQSLASSLLVLFHVFTGSQEIAQRFVIRIRHPYRREIASPVAAAFTASRRSVLTRSPALTGTSDGAMT
jgi:hypothetical protein